jgi:hypothetical protein
VKWRRVAILASITAAAVAVRLAYLAWQLRHPGFEWMDPDGYLRQAGELTRTGAWQWTFDAVSYHWGGQNWRLPPGYPVFLSMFSANPLNGQLAAAVAQSVVGGLAALPVYVVGRALHNDRTGVIAALLWAAWFPSITGRHVFVQEQLYLPLLWTALAMVSTSLAHWHGPLRFAVAGFCLGLATLTRAMPLYFLPVLLVGIALVGSDRRAALRRSLALLAGFALITAPYIAALSLHDRQLVLIDNHMAILQARSRAVPDLASTVRAVAQDVATTLAAKLQMIPGLFQVYGVSWLYYYSPAQTAQQAWWLALAVRVGFDGLFVVTSVLAPLGLVLARQRRVATLLVTWMLTVMVLTVLAGFAGGRYRAPQEIGLICGAAVICGLAWRRPRWPAAAAAVAVSSLIAWHVVPALLRAPALKAPYGIAAPAMAAAGQGSECRGACGFFAAVRGGSIELEVDRATAGRTMALRLDGTHAGTMTIGPAAPARVRLAAGDRSFVFIEVGPADAGAGIEGLRFHVRLVQ